MQSHCFVVVFFVYVCERCWFARSFVCVFLSIFLPLSLSIYIYFLLLFVQTVEREKTTNSSFFIYIYIHTLLYRVYRRLNYLLFVYFCRTKVNKRKRSLNTCTTQTSQSSILILVYSSTFLFSLCVSVCVCLWPCLCQSEECWSVRQFSTTAAREKQFCLRCARQFFDIFFF